MKIFQTVKIKITARLSHPPLFGIIKIVTSFRRFELIFVTWARYKTSDILFQHTKHQQ